MKHFSLQMKHAILNLLRTSLIPELSADVAAGPAGHIHLILIPVAAVRALPDQLAVLILNNLNFPVKTAFLAVVALGIQLRIHDIVVNMT